MTEQSLEKIVCTPQEAIAQVKKGKILILVDEKNRENEGDFFVPAARITAQKLNFMITHGKGLVCVAITKEIAERLSLPLMISEEENQEFTKCNFTVSVDARNDIGSGISVIDRVKTIKILADPESKPTDLVRPGHVFPLLTHKNSLTGRRGHTEAAVELARLSGFTPAGVICEILRCDGEIARLKDLIAMAKRYKIKILLISDLAEYLLNQRNKIDQKAQATLQTKYGKFLIKIFKSRSNGKEHTVLSTVNIQTQKPVLVRLHSQCLTSEVFHSLTCDCREQLNQAMQLIEEDGNGLIVYLNEEGRGIGLANKIKAYKLQEWGLDTVVANTLLGVKPDMRDYQDAAEILHHLDIGKVHLLTNNPAKMAALRKYGIRVTKRISLEAPSRPENKAYLKAKKRKLGHKLNSV